MEFKRFLQCLLLTLMPIYLVTGCGDLEPEMQDTRTVILNMDFQGKSSSRSSSSVSPSELDQYNTHHTELDQYDTHLILAVSPWTDLMSSYSVPQLAQGLMNTANNEVSLQIPDYTYEMKIFVFLFRDTIKLEDLIYGTGATGSFGSAGNQKFGNYGESQSFVIGTGTQPISVYLKVPKGLTATGGASQVVLDWTAVSGATSYRVYWGSATGVSCSSTSISVSTDSYTHTGLNDGTTYYYKVAAADDTPGSFGGHVSDCYGSVGTGMLSSEVNATATTSSNSVTVETTVTDTTAPTAIAGLVDIDGNAYSTVVIGTQHWMAENLKVTKYRNGDNITHITTNSDWTNDTDGAYGYYDDNTTLRDTYGMLYNWNAVDNSSGLCQEGWHVPTDTEFSELEAELGSDAASQLKEIGIDHWASDPGTSNSSGFTALPAGYRSNNNGTYSQISNYAYFWTSSFASGSSIRGTYRRLDATRNNSFVSYPTNVNYGFSVRCLED